MDYYGALFLIGRVLLGGYFLRSAYNHFVNVKQLAGYAASKGVPAPQLAVIGSGLLLLVGGVGILLDRFIEFSVLALVTFTMHRYWKETDPSMKALQSVNFYKNLALLGAVLMLLIILQPCGY